MVEVGLNYQMIGCGKDSVKASLLRGVSTLVKDTTKLYVEKEANQFH